MPEQPQWSERTLDMPPQDPWAEQPTAQAVPPGGAPVPPDPSPFTRGRASVNPRPPKTAQFAADHEPTGTGWPGSGAPSPQREFSWRELRRGGEWTTAGVLFAFVCWGIWAISTDGNLTGPVIIFVCSLAVAAGLFALCRMIGRLVLEKQFGRVRRSAKGSHVVVAIFLIGVGIAHLRQVGWVMDAWNWIVGLAS